MIKRELYCVSCMAVALSSEIKYGGGTVYRLYTNYKPSQIIYYKTKMKINYLFIIRIV